MYDSRTDAPRLRHAHKFCRGAWSAPREALDARAAIAESLADAEAADRETAAAR